MANIIRLGGSSGGSGTGNEVVVNTDAGATVTATNAGTTITAIADTGGVAKLKLSKVGTWAMRASKEGFMGVENVYSVPSVLAMPLLPEFTYTGGYNQREDGVVELLTSGTIVFLTPGVIDVFCVGGGGAGGNAREKDYNRGQGGGGGGYCTTARKQRVTGSYQVTIGAGGVCQESSTGDPTNGGTASFGEIVTAGGGFSAKGVYLGGKFRGGNGGSGGGGGRILGETTEQYGGTDGSNGLPLTAQSNTEKGGKGSSITTREFGEQTGKLYAGGGGGGAVLQYQTDPVYSTGGDGGGGDGGWCSQNMFTGYAKAGGANTGGGGGGGANHTQDLVLGRDGGSGIVCFRAAKSTNVVVSPTPTSGVTYTEGLKGIIPLDVTLFAEAISNNSSITNETSTVYIDFGDVHRKVSVGNQVTIALDDTDYAFDVIGFNHDELTTPTAYGAATATGKAGFTFQMHDLFATNYWMNPTNTNQGGWKNSLMRTSKMATMKGYMPAAWQTAIKPVNKASGTGGGSSSGTETVSDNCFLLAEIEIFGSRTYSVPGEGTQYAYYKAGNSKVKRKGGTAIFWWERSPYSGGSTSFGIVNHNNESPSGWVASETNGVAFAFCV